MNAPTTFEFGAILKIKFMNNRLCENSNVANNATRSNNSNNDIMENVSSIITLAMLKEQGIRIARLAGNRALNEKMVKEKKKSLKKTGLLVPAIIVKAEKAIAEGLEVVDFGTGEQVTEENAMNYFVLVDANHRFKAHLDLLSEDEDYNSEFSFMFPLEDINVTTMLSEINIATNPWKAVDYGKGAAMILDNKLPLLAAINKLTEKGYSIESASLWLTSGRKIPKDVLVKAMSGTIDSSLKDEKKIESGQKLLEAAKVAFSEDFLKKRTMPDWIISKLKEAEDGKTAFIKRMCNFLSKIGRETADKIEKSKGERGGDTKEAIVNQMLNDLWEKSGN